MWKLRTWWLRFIIQTRQSLLSQMLSRRMRNALDPDINGPAQWSDAELEQTPEAHLLDRVERFCWLREAGLDESDAARYLGDKSHGDLKSLMRGELQDAAPNLWELNDRHFERCLYWAKLWGELRVAEGKNDSDHLTSGMLHRQLSTEQIERGLPVKIGFPGKSESDEATTTFWFRAVPLAHEYRDLMKRFAPGDELWEYEALTSAGVALVRKGKIIAHAETIHFSPIPTGYSYE